MQDDNGDKAILREGEFYVPFSVFDNPDIAFRQTYEAALNKISDQATFGGSGSDHVNVHAAGQHPAMLVVGVVAADLGAAGGLSLIHI